MSDRKMLVRRVAVALAVAIAVLVLAVGAQNAVYLRQESHAKMTVSTMAQLHSFLVALQPADTTIASLSELTRREHFRVDFRDDWGHDFVISAASGPDGRFIYTIRSFGRDGQPGPCCNGVLRGQWDQDAVLSDGKWLQNW